MATNNGYSGTLVSRIGYTRSVRVRNRVRRSFGQSGAVLGVFLYLILAVPGNSYLTTGYTRSWLFPVYLCNRLLRILQLKHQAMRVYYSSSILEPVLPLCTTHGFEARR